MFFLRASLSSLWRNCTLSPVLYRAAVESLETRRGIIERIINLRARLLTVEDLLVDSKDPYVTVRESYLQNRQFEVYDGDPPSDDDDLFDEFFEDEDF